MHSLHCLRLKWWHLDPSRNPVTQTLFFQGLQCAHEARDLGVILDSYLSLSKHSINMITKPAIGPIRNIANMTLFLSFGNVQTVIHAFVSCHLDYCNSLFAGLPQKTISCCQLVQTTAARVFPRTRNFEHISPILTSFYWLLLNHWTALPHPTWGTFSPSTPLAGHWRSRNKGWFELDWTVEWQSATSFF